MGCVRHIVVHEKNRASAIVVFILVTICSGITSAFVVFVLVFVGLVFVGLVFVVVGFVGHLT
jgi:hypothetical protein